MYVCICNAVTDSDIRRAVSEGVRDIDELSMTTGCSVVCGTCRDMAGKVLQESLREQRAFMSVVSTHCAA